MNDIINEKKHLALVHTVQIASEDRASTQITVVEPTIVVYSEKDGRITMVETITPKPAGGETTETVFETWEDGKPFSGRDLFDLLLKMGFQNVELT